MVKEMLKLPHFKDLYLVAGLMIQKIKYMLSTLDSTDVGLFFILLGTLIVGSVLYIPVLSVYGTTSEAIPFGIALMIIGVAIL